MFYPFLILFVLLFSTSPLLAGWPGECNVIYYSKTTSTSQFPRDVPTTFTINSSGIFVRDSSVYWSGGFVQTAGIAWFYQKESGWQVSNQVTSYSQPDTVKIPSDWIQVDNTTSAYTRTILPQNCDGKCNTADDDGDGVCNSCDSNPDKKNEDCVAITGTNSATGAVEYMDVDEGCDGSTDTTYSDRTPGSTLNFDLSPTGGHLYKIPSPTCGGMDANGQCACKYPSGTSGAPTANMTKTEYVPITGDPTQPNPDKPDIPDPVIIYPPPSQVTPSDPTIADDPTPDTGSSNEDKQTETQQDIENAIRRLTQMVETQSRALQEKQLTQIERQDAIIALAQTISQLNRYQTLLTETTNDRIKTTNFKLDVVKGAINAASGQISQNVKDLGSKVAGVGTSVDAQGTAIQGKLDGVAGAIDGQGTAIQGKLDGIASALEGQGAATQEGNAKLDAIGDSLDEIKGKIPSNIVAEGTADHPTENTYDPAFENAEDLQEEPLADSISDFIQNGLPLSSYFKGTKVVISGASPTLSVDVFGSSIVVNFSEYEDILRQAGLVLVMIATVIAFMIIANRR